MENESAILRRLQDLAALSEKRNRPVYSDFLIPADAALAFRAAEPYRVTLWGGREGCERQMARFVPTGFPAEFFGTAEGACRDFPIAVLAIRPVQEKFADELTHRDFLGALMNLGITRESLGDLIVQGKEAWVFAQEKLAPFLCENLIQVRHTNVRCEQLDRLPPEAAPRFEAMSFTLSSLRIDAFAAHAAHLSRGKAQELFAREMVFVNGRLCESESLLLKEGDIVTLRHFGKFIFREVRGESRKGRLIVTADRYV